MFWSRCIGCAFDDTRACRFDASDVALFTTIVDPEYAYSLRTEKTSRARPPDRILVLIVAEMARFPPHVVEMAKRKAHELEHFSSKTKVFRRDVSRAHAYPPANRPFGLNLPFRLVRPFSVVKPFCLENSPSFW